MIIGMDGAMPARRHASSATQAPTRTREALTTGDLA
jgi:hypothetical protein